jgi:hypothetical protein
VAHEKNAVGESERSISGIVLGDGSCRAFQGILRHVGQHTALHQPINVIGHGSLSRFNRVASFNE